jgi:hypothetical protein
MFHFVAGHRRPGEDDRACLVREIGEELGLAEGVDYRVSAEGPRVLEFTAFSRAAREETSYRMALFGVELTAEAQRSVEACPENRWLGDEEARDGRCRDGRPVSPTMARLLEALRADGPG